MGIEWKQIDPLRHGFDLCGKRRGVERLSQHVGRVDPSQGKRDLRIGEPPDENRGQIFPGRNEPAFELGTADVRQCQVENEARTLRLDAAGEKRGCRSEGEHLVTADFRSARGRVIRDDDQLAYCG